MVYKFSEKQTGLGAGSSANKEIAQQLHKSVIKKSKRRKMYGRFKYNAGAVDLAEMGSLTSKNWVVKYLLSVMDFFTKYASVKRLKD